MRIYATERLQNRNRRSKVAANIRSLSGAKVDRGQHAEAAVKDAADGPYYGYDLQEGPHRSAYG